MRWGDTYAHSGAKSHVTTDKNHTTYFFEFKHKEHAWSNDMFIVFNLGIFWKSKSATHILKWNQTWIPSSLCSLLPPPYSLDIDWLWVWSISHKHEQILKPKN